MLYKCYIFDAIQFLEKRGENMSNDKICPLCKRSYTGYPAISRIDNKTEICPDCGLRQSLEPIICKFENVICGYAFNEGDCYMCQAPSDDAMPCNKRKSNEQ